MRRTFLILRAAMFAFGISAGADDLETRRQGFQKLLAEQWEYRLSHHPEFASILGDRRWNDKLSDLSIAAILADQGMDKLLLKKFEAVDTTGFPEQETLTRTLLVRAYKESIENAHWKNWEMPETQMDGLHVDAPHLVSLLPFETVKDFEDYAVRLKGLPRQFDDVIDRMQRGMAEKLMPPKFLLVKIAAQAEGIANQKPEDSPFAVPLSEMPDSFPTDDRARLRQLIVSAVRDQVDPAYSRFAKFVREDYAPRGRREPGMWSLPDGSARYAAVVKLQTTTDRTPEEIHKIGLEQVARIEKEANAVAVKLGFRNWKALGALIAKDPERHFHSREEVLARYRNFIDGMKPQLPKLFGRLPKADVLVMPVEQFREREAPIAQYDQGTPDGSRPGHVMVNTSDPESRKTISVEASAYHEGVPGHHLQISIAQELEGLPPVRQQAFYTAFIEGWALYSERLGKEIGFYQDPYSDFGRLQDEMLRAIRLVVDTGLHSKKWTRQQVVNFFHTHSAIEEVKVQSETDRYISDPGQALAYKMGQLKIMELRDRAQKELGDRFNIRAFHDAVLEAGALPLDVLEQRIDRWIAVSKAKT
jgi:uncharacterized protein (DUF885 family)